MNPDEIRLLDGAFDAGDPSSARDVAQMQGGVGDHDVGGGPVRGRWPDGLRRGVRRDDALGDRDDVGASVARMELRIRFEERMKRIPDMRRVPGPRPELVPSAFARGPRAVRVELPPSR